MRLALVLNVCVLASAACSVGCTASYRNAYDGDVRFEHCYRLDEEQNIAPDQKRGCWQKWNRESTFGQPRDRIEYALARERALTAGRPQTGARHTAAGASPMPTSAFAPPPQTLARDAGVVASAPGAYCGAGCGKDWIDCGQSCNGAACQSGCDERYRTCMRRCF